MDVTAQNGQYGQTGQISLMPCRTAVNKQGLPLQLFFFFFKKENCPVCTDWILTIHCGAGLLEESGVRSVVRRPDRCQLSCRRFPVINYVVRRWFGLDGEPMPNSSCGSGLDICLDQCSSYAVDLRSSALVPVFLNYQVIKSFTQTSFEVVLR